MNIYVLFTSAKEYSKVVSGIYSSLDILIDKAQTCFADDIIEAIEEWDLDNGFIRTIPFKKQILITIE